MDLPAAFQHLLSCTLNLPYLYFLFAVCISHTLCVLLLLCLIKWFTSAKLPKCSALLSNVLGNAFCRKNVVLPSVTWRDLHPLLPLSSGEALGIICSSYYYFTLCLLKLIHIFYWVQSLAVPSSLFSDTAVTFSLSSGKSFFHSNKNCRVNAFAEHCIFVAHM